MDKQEFFNQLHKRIAHIYRHYSLEPRDIANMRSMFLTEKWNIIEAANHLQNKLTRAGDGKRKQRYLRILAFLVKCSNDDLEVITKKTAYDK